MQSYISLFNDPPATDIYTLSLHDALPILVARARHGGERRLRGADGDLGRVVAVGVGDADRKSTRLNSSHSQISYAVFCLKKKNQIEGVFLLYCRVNTRRSIGFASTLIIVL